MNKRYDGSETTGFMSPARDHADGTVDLAETLRLSSPGRYPVRVTGGGFASRGILDGDILIVDAAVDPAPGDIVVAVSDGETVLAVAEKRGRRLRLRRPGRYLDEESSELWAVAVALVRERLR